MRRPLLLATLVGVPAVALTLTVLVPAGAADRTAPGMLIGGLGVGGLDRPALERLLRTTADDRPETLRIRLGARTVQVVTSELGVELDVAATVQQAMTTSGRRLWRRSGSPQVVRPVLRTDPVAFQATVERLVSAAQVPESHGSLRPAGAHVVAVPPADGQHAVREPMGAALLQHLGSLPWPEELALPVSRDRAHVAASQTRRLEDQANTLLRARSLLRAGTRQMPLSAAQLAANLTLTATPQPVTHGLVLDLRSGRHDLADMLATDLSVAAREPEVDAPRPDSLLREQGSVTWRPVPAATRLRVAGRPGQRVRPGDVRTALLGLLHDGPAPTGVVTVPASPVLPATSDRDAARIDSVLGTFTTSFACCQPRVTNITLMARALDGVIIGAGRQLSLNGLIGPRTKDKGYVEAPFILDGELSTDVGGGVSQVATTMLNAAFFAGLGLDAHRAHSFYISRYPPGREATVNYPSIDLRWTNDSAGPVLVRTRVSATSLTVALYGIGDGRAVTATTGSRQPVPGKDFRITVVRTIARPNQSEVTARFTTTYNKPPEDE